MALSRCVETRLLEAVWTETKKCFLDSARTAAGYATLGLDSLYYANGVARIFARPFSANETIQPYMIAINPDPPQWKPGVGGVSDNYWIIEVAFIFPFDQLNITAGANSFLDHVSALHSWLTAGGSWPNKTMSIQDPDNLGHGLAHLTAFAQAEHDIAPNNVGVVVPVMVEYETRTDRTGALA